MKHWLYGAALAAASLGTTTSSVAVELNVGCSGIGQEMALCKSAAEQWARKTGNVVRVYETPPNASNRLSSYRFLLDSKSTFLDVIQIDIVWSGMLAPHLLDLKPYTNGAEKAHFAGVLNNNMVGGRLVAMPWFTDAGLLYYRRDLLEKYKLPIPATWDDLTATAKKIQDAERLAGRPRMWGYVWQGRAYEGLTCNALEWITAAGGGTVMDSSGSITVNNPQAVKAVQTAAGWIGSISPNTTLRSMEEDARTAFQEGNAVFMRNWPYAWSLMQSDASPVKGRVGVAALPHGSGAGARGASTLGGQQLAIPAYTQHPKEAAELVLYMTGPEVQKQRALQGSFNPTLTALYQDPDVRRALPWAAQLSAALADAVARPSTPAGASYERLSNAFSIAINDVLASKIKADESLRQLEAALVRMRYADNRPEQTASLKP